MHADSVNAIKVISQNLIYLLRVAGALVINDAEAEAHIQ
ncbi:hypothetical protein JCM19231_3657 [Vibrio ishigakensis]|uniref:Uncharacterized protein n=1 Tax=Vibrio ishigakensis TaxID=1481914 RepID=A0A0B8NP72_9VIBR|nr:hypothetical protein JCM19231_3657 [Vibrio ishigakensis]